MRVEIYARSESFEIKPPNSAYPPQVDTAAAASASASGSGSGSNDTASPSASASSSDKPNDASRGVGAGSVVLGVAAFGGMLMALEGDLGLKW